MKSKKEKYKKAKKPETFSFSILKTKIKKESPRQAKTKPKAAPPQKPHLPAHLQPEIRAEKKVARKKKWAQFRQGFHHYYKGLKWTFFSLILLFGAGACFVFGTASGYFAQLVQDFPIPSKLELDQKIHNLHQRSYLNYANGQRIATLNSDVARTTLTSKEIPKQLQEAVVDTEDPNFFQHQGVVPKAILRAFIGQATGLTSPSGGSTLTQQLVKQQLLSSESSLERKAKEVLLALRLEKYFSKEDILTTYLNVCSFGRNNKGENIAGVLEAAKGIFGKAPAELSLAQTAYIAGLPQSPMVYCPYDSLGQLKTPADLKAGLLRKDLVLENMYRQGHISQTQYEAAKKEDITKSFLPHQNKEQNNDTYLYFALKDAATKCLMPALYEADGYAKERVMNDSKLYQHYYDLAETKLSNGGYVVTSTIDPTIYQAMQKSIQTFGPKLDVKGKPQTEVGNVLLDNQSGRIYGFVAGRNFNKNQNNHALQTKRSPASTMKPLMVYAPALEEGLINSQTMLNNAYVTYKNGREVTNYGHSRGQGFESATDALKYSHNIPVISLYQALLKQGGVYPYIRDLGLGLSEEQCRYESSPLGTNEVTVVAQTGAYACLANKGIFNPPYLIESIKDEAGNTIYEHQKDERQIFSEATASIMNEMMRHVLTDKGATGQKAYAALKKQNKELAKGDWIAKTGTSEYNTDFWFIASTPKVTLSSWVGYDNNQKLSEQIRDENLVYWAYLAQQIQKADHAVLGLNERFHLSPEVIKAEVSNQTGTKFGSCYYEGKKYKVKGKKVEALAAEEKAITEPRFRFGIGGTAAQYAQAWQQ